MLYREPNWIFTRREIGEDDFKLDWFRAAEVLRRWIQTSPGQCFCDIAGRRLYFVEAEAVGSDGGASPGVLVQIGRTSCTVSTGEGALRVRRARLVEEGEKPPPQLFRELGLKQGDALI